MISPGVTVHHVRHLKACALGKRSHGITETSSTLGVLSKHLVD